MYWIYLAIFVVIVFVPDLVTGGFLGLKEQSTEELAIFFLGGAGFIIYLAKERRLAKYIIEKAKIQRDANRMNKDLTSSYSYIGEINRKIEIFKNISLGLADWSRIPKMREKEAFVYIIAAIKIITRQDEYSLRFANIQSFTTLLEIKSKPKIKFDFSVEKCISENKKYFETSEYIITISPEDIEDIISIITIKKKKNTNSSDDPDILKSIAALALFLFKYSNRNGKKIKG